MQNIPIDQQQKSEWFVLGAGALGCLWGAMLAQCGGRVTLIVRNANQQHRQPAQLHFTQLQASQLQNSQLQNTGPVPAQRREVENPKPHTAAADTGRATTAGPCAQYAAAAKQTPASPPTTFEVDQATLLALANERTTIANLLVTTKSYDALTAIEAILPLLEPGAKVLTLFNGYGLHQPIAKLLSSQQRDIELYAGVSSDGALLRAPLDVVHTGMGTTKIGRFNGQAATHFLPAKLSLAVQYVDDIEASILKKFFINCAINPLTALHNCTNGKLLSEPALYLVFQKLCGELQDIYQAVLQITRKGKPGIANAGFDVLQQASQVAAATAANRSSMLQDFRKRRALELQYLNQEAIVMAKRYGIACPINERLVAQLQPVSQ